MSDLKTTIMDSMKNLVTLEIVTAIGQVQFKPKADKPEDADRHFPDLDYERNPKMIMTKIDLLQGDIKTVFNEEFVTGEYWALREFHEAREKEGHDIIQKNIDTLERLLKLAASYSEG